MADVYIDTYVDTYDDAGATGGGSSGGGTTDAYDDTYFDTYGVGTGTGGTGGAGGGEDTPPVNPELTVVGLYHPEIVYDVPPLEPARPRFSDRLFRYFSSRPRGVNVWLVRQSQDVPFLFGTTTITLTATKRQPQPTFDEQFVARGNVEFGPAGYVRLLDGGAGTHALNLEEYLAVNAAVSDGSIGGTLEALDGP